ncbi:MAG TPA: hypothetical protein VLG50_02445 [Candidatus Saccharimonadales bacterium]|nr:hypothetical protein [Candidatus Saccharimonadales bacterium]
MKKITFLMVSLSIANINSCAEITRLKDPYRDSGMGHIEESTTPERDIYFSDYMYCCKGPRLALLTILDWVCCCPCVTYETYTKNEYRNWDGPYRQSRSLCCACVDAACCSCCVVQDSIIVEQRAFEYMSNRYRNSR